MTEKHFPKIGVAIATYNNVTILKECLFALQGSDWPNLYIVVLDDCSSDNTEAMLEISFPEVDIVHGTGELWWTAGTNRAILKCIENDCSFIVVQNPDVIVGPDTITNLFKASEIYHKSIIAPVVLDYHEPNLIWWAGTRWGNVHKFLPFLWTSRYLYKKGSLADSIENTFYQSSEAHGRSVFVPVTVFKEIGLYDEKIFPHYGADIDFSFRAGKYGIKIFIAPEIRVKLYTENTGMRRPINTRDALIGYSQMLFKRKNGEIAVVWWKLLSRYLPLFDRIFTFIFVIFLNTYRYWIGFLKSSFIKRSYCSKSRV
jgi:GT2 family glycosyltransferase